MTALETLRAAGGLHPSYLTHRLARADQRRPRVWRRSNNLWAIALLEYCLAVPANRLGYGQFSGFQLKIAQEVITLVVFIVFAVTFLNEKLAWNYIVAFAFLGVAAYFAFAFKAPAPPRDIRNLTHINPIRAGL